MTDPGPPRHRSSGPIARYAPGRRPRTNLAILGAMRSSSVRAHLRRLLWVGIAGVLALAAPAPAAAYDFDWVGKIELEAKALASDDARIRVRAVSALSRYDISLTKTHLLAALVDTDASVRFEAAQALGRHANLAAVPTLIGWLNDPDTRTRQVAVDTLGAIGGPKALESLIRTLGDMESTVRLRAVVALGTIGGDAVVVPLIGRLDDDKSEVRRAAIEQLQALGDRRAVIPVVGAFSDSSVEVRKAAVAAVGHLGDDAAVAALVRLLRDSVDEIKISAVASLGHLAATEALDRLVSELGRGSDPYRARVAFSIGQIVAAGKSGDAGTRALETLVAELANPRRRAAVREALLVAGTHATPALIAHLRGDIDGDPTTSVTLLRELGDGRATAALLAEIDRGRVQLELILDALAKVGDASALIPVLGLLSSDDVAVRMQVMLSLRPLLGADARAADVLLDRLKDPDLEIRALAIEYLGLMRSVRALPALAELATTDVASRIRHAAVVALGEIGDAAGTDPLIATLETGPKELHRAAATALIYIGNPASVAPLETIASNPKATSRNEAVRALAGVTRARLAKDTLALLARLAKVQAESLALSAIAGLGSGGNPDAVPSLVALLERETVERARAAARALGDIAGPTDQVAIDALVVAVTAPDDRLAGDASWALAKLYGRAKVRVPDQVAAALVRATARGGWSAPINATAALALAAPKENAELLRRLIHHRSAWIRINAARGLANGGDKSAIPALVAMAKTGSASSRDAALRALSQLGAKDALAAVHDSKKNSPDIDEVFAALLAKPFLPASRTEWRSFHVVDPGTDDSPVRREPYFLIGPDSVVTAYYTDARGVIEEEWFAEGDYVLAPKSHADKY